MKNRSCVVFEFLALTDDTSSVEVTTEKWDHARTRGAATKPARWKTLITALGVPRKIRDKAEELRERAERARERLEAAGEIDALEDRQGVGADAAPAFDTLQGKTIEVRWRYWSVENGKRQQVRT